jgi:NADH:ubiquinone oxidoreductase subunit 4 (subunit M)
MFGEIKKEENRNVKDLGGREVLIMCCIVFFVILMGVYPKMFFNKMDTSVEGFLNSVRERNAYYQKHEGTPPGAALDHKHLSR